VTGVRKGEGGGNEQIAIYFSQIHVYFLNDIMYKYYILYNEYHDYPSIAAAECFV